MGEGGGVLALPDKRTQNQNVERLVERIKLAGAGAQGGHLLEILMRFKEKGKCLDRGEITACGSAR
jgi:hypothetical protein